MSDTQIHYLIAQSKGKVCGNFREDQLNRAMMISEHRKSPDLLSVVLGMSLLVIAYPSYSSDTMISTPSYSLIEQLQYQESIEDGHEYIQLRFQVLDAATGESIPFVKLQILDENDEFVAGAYSDFDGNIELKLSPDQFDAAKKVATIALDYEDKQLEWNEDWKAENSIAIHLNSEVAIVQPEHRENAIRGMVIRVDDWDNIEDDDASRQKKNRKKRRSKN
ncbi:MAG: hypothetical protein Crog4KO_15040 [Crocinitomicaceae bacterium]